MIAYRTSDVKFEFSNRSFDYEHAPVISDEENHKKPLGEIIQNSVTTHHGSNRLRRALGGNTCQMYLVADTYFYNSFGNRDMGDTVIFMVTIIGSLDDRTYRQTLFDLSGITVKGIGVQVGSILVHTDFNDDLSRFPYNRNDDADIGVVLNRFSTLPPNDPPANEPQQDRSCLAHLFTFQSFSRNRLGLANIASATFGATGGICSTVVRVGSDRMVYNTGVSSFIIGRRVLFRAEAQLVVAHEIGHSWGSLHDPPDNECGQQYLMYAFAHTGSDPKNFQFSDCSRRMIAGVLNNKGGCFVDTLETKCGNFILEGEEDCDAGLNRDDPCCDDNCRLKQTAECSDVNYDCCTNCSASTQSQVCHRVTEPSTDCTADTFCDGTSFQCPPLNFQPNGTRCIFGRCTSVVGSRNTTCSSLCVVYNRIECQCEGEDACKVCCYSNDNTSCVPLNPTDPNDIELLDLSDGVNCGADGRIGRCNNGTCMTEPQDGIQRLFRFIRNLSGDAVIRAIEENIVGFVLICNLLVWAPVSLLLHFLVDRKLYKRVKKHLSNHHEKNKIRHLSRKKPKEQNPRLELNSLSQLSDHPSSFLGGDDLKTV